MVQSLGGVIADVPTPRNGDGLIVFGVIQALVDRLVSAGVTAILVTGTVGEARQILTIEFKDSEHIHVIEAYIMAAKGRVPIIACLPDIFGGLERQWYQGFKELGCYAILLTDLDNISNLGIKVEDPNNLALLYCSPGLSSEGKYIGLHGNVIYGDSQSSKKGITESSMQTQDETQHENRTYIGTDLMCFSALALGAPGIISGMATIVPQHCVELYRTLAIEKDLVKARKQWKHLWELACFLQKVDYATGVAAALKITGIDIGPRLFPFKKKSLSEEELKALQQILQKFSKT